MTDQPATTPPAMTTSITEVNAACMKRIIAAGLAWFERHYEQVNRLNVFPVPDGDTGTNMLLTLKSAYKKMAETDKATDDNAAGKASALATGAIFGSRGNSGTLLSQMFDGFAKAIGDRAALNASDLSKGFSNAVHLAYRALEKPVEGTILTVAREIAEEVEAVSKHTDDLKHILERVVQRGTEAVQKTPELLPILKKAGVVDSGGRGLVIFFEGMLRALRGEPITTIATGDGGALAIAAVPAAALTAESELRKTLTAEDERGYGYDVQYIVKGKNLDVDQIRRDIIAMGDSTVVVGNAEMVKVHVHVHDPGAPISYGIRLGVIADVVVENMQEQAEGYIGQRELENEQAEEESAVQVNPGDAAAIAVAPGDGLRRVFLQLGVAGVVLGGQTMNPSVDDFLAEMSRHNTDRFVLLPNNKNVVLTAEQVARVAKDRGWQVAVIKTVNVPQGIAAMLSFNPTGTLDEVAADMKDAFSHVATGEITRATRDVEIDGVKVENGQLIGLVDGKLAVANDEIRPLMQATLDRMHARDKEVVTLYYGAQVSKVNAESMAVWLRDSYAQDGAPAFELVYGGQPHYDYILSAE